MTERPPREAEPVAPRLQLEASIAAAFRDVPHPGDHALVSGDVSYDPEYREVARDFSGMAWPGISAAFVREHADALALLSPAAFRYFLPAYLLACLATGAELDTAPLNVLGSLTPPEDADPEASEFFASRVVAFTRAEARAICAYLEAWPADDTTAALAYWSSRT